MLIHTVDEDESINLLKRSIDDTIYMDNAGYTCNDEQKLEECYETVPKIFAQYKFGLQQFCSNSSKVQSRADGDFDIKTDDEVKLFGMSWFRGTDVFSPMKILLDTEANTKREVLRTINSIYDVFNVYAPILLRARIFMQNLQADKILTWDKPISLEQANEWKLIVKQANNAPRVEIPRSMGSRGSRFELIAFSDASAQAMGVVVYMKDLDNNSVSFVSAKYKLVQVTCTRKMPSLELFAMSIGVKFLHDIYNALCGETVVSSVNILKLYLYSDSLVCLQWLDRYSSKWDSMKTLSIFARNKLRAIDESCLNNPVTFRHISGTSNPADFLTRPCNHNTLAKSNFMTGPKCLVEFDREATDFEVNVPNPVCKSVPDIPIIESDLGSEDRPPQIARQNLSVAGNTLDESGLEFSKFKEPIEVRSDSQNQEAPNQASTEKQVETQAEVIALHSIGSSVINSGQGTNDVHHLISPERFSKFSFLKNTLLHVYRFINNVKRKLSLKNPDRSWTVIPETDLHSYVLNTLISVEQKLLYPDVYTFFKFRANKTRKIPEIITKLNLYKDEHDVLRVQSKFPKEPNANPILLSKDSVLSQMLIYETHITQSHSGIYQTLRELRRSFHITCFFSAVKRVVNKCVTCRKINRHPIKLNQNRYKDLRIDPPSKPFSSVYMDYIGPFTITLEGTRKKVWLLAITCLYSRALALHVCQSANLNHFLRAIQLHCFQFGIFQNCISDLGSQLQAGANTISTFLNDFETKSYFESNGMKLVSFQHYAKGNSSLGALIESLVKQVKHLIFKSIRNSVLDYFDFEYIVEKSINLINKRPIAFKDGLRSDNQDEVPISITPEMVLRGYETVAVNVVPTLQPLTDEYMVQNGSVADSFEKLRKVRQRLLEVYHHEFIGTLISQATDKNSRYVPVRHEPLQEGDIVLLVEPFLKQYHYQMGRVLTTEINSLGEVTAAYILKGSTREKVYRHVTSLILLMRSKPRVSPPPDISPQEEELGPSPVRRNAKRAAAQKCMSRIRHMQNDDAI